jgi:Ribbon-helix-helix protein
MVPEPPRQPVRKMFFRCAFVYPLGTLQLWRAGTQGLRIRVERPLRQAFVDACRKQDKPAAQVIREFMRGFIARNTSEAGIPPDGNWDQQPPGGGNQVKTLGTRGEPCRARARNQVTQKAP